MRLHFYPVPALAAAFRPGDASPASVVHKAYARELWRERGALGRLSVGAALAAWPLVHLGTSIWATARNGPAIARRTGRGVARQLADQLALAVSTSVPPPWYYAFELFDADKRRRAGAYLHRYETKQGIYALLKRGDAGESSRKLSDKVAFARACNERGLPAVSPLLAYQLDGGRVPAEAPSFPHADLVVKPTYGKGGRDIERWEFREGGFWEGAEGQRLDAPGLVEYVRTRPRRCLVQPRLKNHPALLDLANGALSTARVVTILDENGEAEATHAVFRMAVGMENVVDNFHAGGIAARIDMETGELGRASDMGFDAARGWCEVHPDSGAAIVGRKLPFWQETLDLVRRAHAAFRGTTVIGWDVAPTPDGPVLVEGNGGPDLDILQRIYGAPVGDSRFGELLAFHVRSALATSGDRASGA